MKPRPELHETKTEPKVVSRPHCSRDLNMPGLDHWLYRPTTNGLVGDFIVFVSCDFLSDLSLKVISVQGQYL